MRYTVATRVSFYGKCRASSRTLHNADRYAPRRRKALTAILKSGGLAVMPTDTLYGIVARASDKKAVRRLYRLRRNTPRKPFIVLIYHQRALARFGVVLSGAQKSFLKAVWPGKVSVILPCRSKRFRYLHRGAHTLAFRVPKGVRLRALLKKTGPLAAPSANPEGEKPAETIAEAKRYFGNRVDSYVSARRRLRAKASTLVSLLGRDPKIIRQGSVKISA